MPSHHLGSDVPGDFRAVRVRGDVYACGDLHGRYDLMEDFLAWVARERRGEPVTIVFLGDYVDRGPDGRRILERLMRGPGPGRPGETWIPLKGNHDALFASACREPSGDGARTWTRNGGLETLESYGGGEGGGRFPAIVPESHVRFVENMANVADDGERLYVHAGVRPGVAFAEQTERDLLWIREDFLDHDHGFTNRVIVHGHTIHRGGPDMRDAGRIGMDSGAYATGMLTCARFRPGDPVPTFYRTGQVATHEGRRWDAPGGREIPVHEARPWKPLPEAEDHAPAGMRM